MDSTVSATHLRPHAPHGTRRMSAKGALRWWYGTWKNEHGRTGRRGMYSRGSKSLWLQLRRWERGKGEERRPGAARRGAALVDGFQGGTRETDGSDRFSRSVRGG